MFFKIFFFYVPLVFACFFMLLRAVNLSGFVYFAQVCIAKAR